MLIMGPSSLKNNPPSLRCHNINPTRVSTFLAIKSNAVTNGQCAAVILPGLGNNSTDYNQLVTTLEAKGVPTTVAQVSRLDWLRNASGLLDGNYWKGTLSPRPVLDWYLKRMQKAIAAAKGEASDKVCLIGHSAGGWLARVYMSEFGTHDISLLLTLGTPHLPPPRGVPGVFDQTRGLLYHVNDTSPGAFHTPYKYDALRYVEGAEMITSTPVATTGIGTIGTGVLLEEAAEKASENKGTSVSLRQRFIGQGYKQVCGKADVWGDGVVPEMSAHLEGAINITLDGVYHSPVGANEERYWYGSPAVVDQWINFFLHL